MPQRYYVKIMPQYIHMWTQMPQQYVHIWTKCHNTSTCGHKCQNNIYTCGQNATIYVHVWTIHLHVDKMPQYMSTYGQYIHMWTKCHNICPRMDNTSTCYFHMWTKCHNNVHTWTKHPHDMSTCKQNTTANFYLISKFPGA